MRSFPGEAMMDGSNSVYGRTLYLTHISLFSSLLSLHPHLPHLASPPHHTPTAEDTTADPERHHHSPHKLKVPLPGPRAAEHHTCLAAAAAAASFFGDTAFAAASSAVALRADVRKLVAAVVAAHAAAAPGWAGSSSPPSPAELAVAAVI